MSSRPKDTPPYRWRIVPVPGVRVRRFGWWLREFRWPGQRTIKARSRRYRVSRWLLAITDDRAWTLRHQSTRTRWWRSRLGKSEREYELEEIE